MEWKNINFNNLLFPTWAYAFRKNNEFYKFQYDLLFLRSFPPHLFATRNLDLPVKSVKQRIYIKNLVLKNVELLKSNTH